MAKVIFAITLTLVTFTLIKCANTKSNQMTKEAPVNAKDQDSSIDVSDLDTQAIMNACNESFRIEMSMTKEQFFVSFVELYRVIKLIIGITFWI